MKNEKSPHKDNKKPDVLEPDLDSQSSIDNDSEIKDQLAQESINGSEASVNQSDEAFSNRSSEEKIDNKLLSNDLISMKEIESYFEFLSYRNKVNGFRRGKVPVVLMSIKFPNAINDMIQTYLRIKAMSLYQYGIEVEIASATQTTDGIEIIYNFHDSTKKNQEETPVDQKGNTTNNQSNSENTSEL